MSAVLKHYENQGSNREDLVLLKWVCEDSLCNIQTALKGIMKNLPVPFVGSLCNFIIFPFSKPYQRPKGWFTRNGEFIFGCKLASGEKRQVVKEAL